MTPADRAEGTGRPEHRLALPAALTRGEATALRQALLAALPPAGRLVVDAASVLEVDGAGVQLLLALARSARARRVGVDLVNASPALEAVLASHHAREALAW